VAVIRIARIAPKTGKAMGVVIALALLLVLSAAPPATTAQPVVRISRIGWLAPGPIPGNLEALRSDLRALGYFEDNTVVIDERYAGGGVERLRGAATELLGRHPDIVVADGRAAATAIKHTGSAIPVVFVSGDPVAMGLVPRLSRPGGTMTGFGINSTELNVKRLELLRDAFPRLLRVGVLHEPRHLDRLLPSTEAGARTLGLQPIRLQVRDARDIEGAFATAIRERVQVIMPVSSALFHAEQRRIVTMATKHRLPAIYEGRGFPEAGGLMSYGPDLGDVFRRAAVYVDRILKGAKPADLPVEEPTKFELVLNLETAKLLDLPIPPSLLARADRIIQ
jgi:putative tryptophan/tyrosine transport system substrate-binding protein